MSPELHPVQVKTPWYHIGVDFIGPIHASKQGNQLILTLSDYCTKYVDAVALSTKCASVTAGALFKVLAKNFNIQYHQIVRIYM